MDKNVSSGGGIGMVTLLTVLFIALKLTGVIAWSWWSVLSPLLISVLFVGLLLFLLFILVIAFDESHGMTFRRK